MLKSIGITVIVATAVAVTAPRDLLEVATLSVRAGILLIKLGLALHPPGYDAAPLDDDDETDIEAQRAAVSTRLALPVMAG